MGSNPGKTHYIGDDCPGGHWDDLPSTPRPQEQPAQVVSVNRTRLRNDLRAVLAEASGNTVVVTTNAAGGVKIIAARAYFEAMIAKMKALQETLGVVTDRKLFAQILAAADTLEEDLRLGKLHSLEDAFGETDE